ncbi:MAG: hypothetical protein ABIQ50_18740 [Usitatibacter sp.]
MDERERMTLEREVQGHLARVEELLSRKTELEERMEGAAEPANDLAQEVKAIKIELRGRMAAIAMGESRLGIDPF